MTLQTDPKQMTRRDRNRLRNRGQILAAALSVFSEKGYHEASIQEIADRADFAVSTLYSLFESKENLYKASYTDLARRCGRIFDEAMERGGNEYEKLVNFMRAKGEIFRENPDGIRLFQHELFSVRTETESEPGYRIREVYHRFMIRIADLFASGIRTGLFREHDPHMLAIALDGLTNEFALRSMEDPDRYPYLENVERMADIFFGPVLLHEADEMTGGGDADS